MKQIALFRQRKMHRNKKGGIEGLPLQLLIIIVIAGLGLSIMVGWMNNISEPDRIDAVDAKVGGQDSDGGYTITVRVTDQNGDGIEGADVILTGYGAYMISDKVNTTDYVNVNRAIMLNGTPTTGKVLRTDLVKAGYNPNNYESCTVIEKGTEKATPHCITDEDGCAVITVHFDNLKTFGTVNIEVSKGGYSGMTTSVKVFA